jgi:hypothetical protein
LLWPTPEGDAISCIPPLLISCHWLHLPLLHFSHSISSDSRSYHAKLHPRVRHDLFKRELQAIAVPGPSFHIENITSPALLYVAYELARISSVSRQIGHPYSSPPTQEGTARNCGPRAIVSCPVHRLLPLHQSRIRSRLNHIRFTSDCTPVFATAYSRGGRKKLSPPGFHFVSSRSPSPPTSHTRSRWILVPFTSIYTRVFTKA